MAVATHVNLDGMLCPTHTLATHVLAPLGAQWRQWSWSVLSVLSSVVGRGGEGEGGSGHGLASGLTAAAAAAGDVASVPVPGAADRREAVFFYRSLLTVASLALGWGLLRLYMGLAEWAMRLLRPATQPVQGEGKGGRVQGKGSVSKAAQTAALAGSVKYGGMGMEES